MSKIEGMDELLIVLSSLGVDIKEPCRNALERSAKKNTKKCQDDGTC